jgi:hypothetical protein
MDIYSDLRIPFSTAVWLRTHKFSPLAVAVSRRLKLIANARVEIASLECQLDIHDKELQKLLDEANTKLEESANGY